MGADVTRIIEITIIEKLWNSPGILRLPGNSQDCHFWVIRNWPWNLSGIFNFELFDQAQSFKFERENAR